jgi:hypothetical protein
MTATNPEPTAKPPPSSFSGGCACGAIRYHCSAPPIVMINCHCRDCQKAGGGGYSANIAVLAAAFSITKGQPAFYESAVESGNTGRRAFCSACGSRLFAQSSGGPEYVGILAGSLDDPSWYAPVADIWVASAQPWVRMDPGIAKFDRGPPLPSDDERRRATMSDDE